MSYSENKSDIAPIWERISEDTQNSLHDLLSDIHDTWETYKKILSALSRHVEKEVKIKIPGETLNETLNRYLQKILAKCGSIIPNGFKRYPLTLVEFQNIMQNENLRNLTMFAIRSTYELETWKREHLQSDNDTDYLSELWVAYYSYLMNLK